MTYMTPAVDPIVADLLKPRSESPRRIIRVVLLAVALLALLSASYARAEYDLKLSLALLPVTGFAQLAIHEGAHAAIPVLRGRDAQIRFFPGGGRFGETITWRRDITPATVALPMVVDLAVIVAVPLILDDCESTWVASWLQSWRLAATGDLIWNLTGVFRGRDTDASMLADYAHAKPGLAKGLALTGIALTVTAVAVTF